MSGFMIAKVHALFSTGSQSTGLAITGIDDGTYEVDGVYRISGAKGFPARELVEREGRVYAADVEGLVSTLLSVCRQDWYHHYVGPQRTSYLYCGESWWSLRIEYSDGSVRRWEGSNDAPQTIDGAYDLLVSFGMPRLKLGYRDVWDALGGRTDEEASLERLSCYGPLLAEACSLGDDDAPSEGFELLAREFLEDVSRYLSSTRPDMALPKALAAWGIEPTLDALTAADVSRAPRGKMLALFGALARSVDAPLAVSRMLDSGALGNWCARLAEIPEEERREEDRRRKEHARQLLSSVDSAVRKRLESGTIFTAADIAQEVGSSTQQASMRIRSFVRAGQLQTVGDDYPRRYQAA